MKFEIKMPHLLLIIGVIIFIIPTIAVLPALIKSFDFSTTGQIGDTIGGITSPFINAIGAVLVYLAFKEQIKANKLIMEQQLFQHIQEQIHRLEDDAIGFSEAKKKIFGDLRDSSRNSDNLKDNIQVNYSISKSALNKAKYAANVFILTSDIINETTEMKESLFMELRMLYVIIYEDNFISFSESLRSLSNMQSNSKTEEGELLRTIDILKTKFRTSGVQI